MTSYLSKFGRKIAARDGWKCHYCGAALVPYGTSENDRLYFEPTGDGQRRMKSKFRKATIDHVKPLSKGGTCNLQNMVLACFDCNQAKADLPAGQLARNWRQGRES